MLEIGTKAYKVKQVLLREIDKAMYHKDLTDDEKIAVARRAIYWLKMDIDYLVAKQNNDKETLDKYIAVNF